MFLDGSRLPDFFADGQYLAWECMEAGLLYLHIGSMKAGSTTIQKFLARNENCLPYRQIQAFSTGNSSRLAVAANTHRSHAYWVEHRKLFSESEYKFLQHDIWDAAKREKETYPDSKFVASSEFIYDQFENCREAIEEFKLKLENIFEDVKIIIYFRDQISFLKSLYAQDIQGSSKSTCSFSTFMSNLHEIKCQWDYASKVKLWGSVFGEENLRLAVFHRDNFHKGNLLEDFLFRIDIHDYRLCEKDYAEKLNPSPTYFQLNLMRFFNNSAYCRKKLKRIYMSKFIEKFGPREFPQTYDDQILRLVNDGNCWLNARFMKGFPRKLPTVDLRP